MAESLVVAGVLVVLLIGVIGGLALEVAHFGREFINESPALSAMLRRQSPPSEEDENTPRTRPQREGRSTDDSVELATERRSRDTIRRMIDYFEESAE